MSSKRSHGIDLHREADYSVPYEDLSTIEKRRRTTMEKYGVDNVHKLDSIKAKTSKTNLEKYDTENPMQNKDIAKKSTENRLEHIDKVTESSRKTWLEQYRKNNSIDIIHSSNSNFENLLKDNSIVYTTNYYIDDSSYDFKIDNMLVEIDSSSISVDKNYHLYKTLLAEDNGFECIHIFDWDDKEKIVGMLKPKTKISADSCQLWRLNKDITNEFLDKYDLQGSCRNQLLCLGLVLDNEIVQVMTFGKSVYDKKHNIVIRRMCTKFGYDIIGGYNRLLNYATEYMELYSVMIYVDASKHSKSLYENLDMTFLKKNAPRKIWSKEDKYKMDYTNRIYLSKDPEFISLGKSYDDYMIDKGWDMVYDCGVYVFEY